MRGLCGWGVVRVGADACEGRKLEFIPVSKMWDVSV